MAEIVMQHLDPVRAQQNPAAKDRTQSTRQLGWSFACDDGGTRSRRRVRCLQVQMRGLHRSNRVLNRACLRVDIEAYLDNDG